MRPREPSDCRAGHTRRVDTSLLASTDLEDGTAFVCGWNGFVEAARQFLPEAHCEPQRIRAERTGLTG